MSHSNIFRNFIFSEKTSGFTIIICTFISMMLANSSFGNQYVNCWNTIIFGSPLIHWINDGLMSIFFLQIGLELKREFVFGELSNTKVALLPIISALGGVIIPVIIFLLFNRNSDEVNAAGIPMATDIAFALGILSLLGNKIPASLKIFLTTLAVIDDLLAIVVIAFFYSNSISILNLTITISLLLILYIFNRFKINYLTLYLFGGIAMWYFMLHSGIHATLTGVLLAFVIPIGKGDNSSSSFKLQLALHKPVALMIVPLFVLANTGIILNSNWQIGIFSNLSMGIILGLIIGKPLGIYLFSRISVITGICKLPKNVTWKHILGVGILAGLGFTMSIFITLLAFKNQNQIDIAKISIFIASAIAGITGFAFLSMMKNKNEKFKVKIQ